MIIIEIAFCSCLVALIYHTKILSSDTIISIVVPGNILWSWCRCHHYHHQWLLCCLYQILEKKSKKVLHRVLHFSKFIINLYAFECLLVLQG